MTDLKNAELMDDALEQVTGGVSHSNGGVILGDQIDVEERFGKKYYYYHVVNGDKLGMIAAYFKTTTGELMKLNPQIPNANAIYVGQRIRVPGPKNGG